MKHNSRLIVLTAACILVLTSPWPLVAAQQQYSESDYYFYEPGPVRQSTLYLDGSVVESETGMLISPVIGSDLSRITPEEFRNMVLEAHREFENAPKTTIVSPDRAGRGINIIFNCTSVPAPAMAALESAAVYIEQLFDDNVTVTINISYDSLPPGVIGWAISYLAPTPSWSVTRASLVNDMDADDTIQTWLPTTSTIPVRYTYGSTTITDENLVEFRVAPYNAVIGSYPGLAAEIQFSTEFNFDYDPSDGVSGMCFLSVAVHEVGHVLGFGSNAASYGIEVMDIYRFQNTDGAGNYNPDTWYDFQNTARMVDLSPGTDDVNSDMIAVEYRMSDGNPYQASHFSQGNVYALMQPAISTNQTYYPNFYKVPDRDMFDAIGWDYILMYYLTTNVAGQGSVTRSPDTTWYTQGAAVELTAIPDAGWMFNQWSGDLSGSDNPDTIIMDYDRAVIASFVTLNCTLTVNTIGNGIVNRVPELPYYPRGSAVELTAVPDSGWVFSHWSGNLWGSQNPDTIIMNGDKTVNANFTYTGVEEGKMGLMASTYFNISPNPTSGRTDIRYQISDNGNATLEIYDASGKLVRSFDLESRIMNHESTIRWDGTDQANRQVGSGVYFIKFKAGDYRTTMKLLLIR
jgi:hypothetical protein